MQIIGHMTSFLQGVGACLAVVAWCVFVGTLANISALKILQFIENTEAWDWF